jgi:hypothetical protein
MRNPIRRVVAAMVLLSVPHLVDGSAPADAATRLLGKHAIGSLHEGYLVGGVINGRWIDDIAAAKAVPGPVAAWRATLTGESPIKLPAVKPGGTPCEDNWSFGDPQPNLRGVTVTEPTWPLIPRPVEQLDPNGATYQTLVGEFLKRKGIKQPVVKVRTLVRTDLDADGSLDVVIEAAAFADGDRYQGQVRPGDYSVVFIRTIINKKVVEVPVDVFVGARSDQFGHDSFLAALADVNGDGRIEIVVDDTVYEGSGTTVYEFRNGKVKKVAEAGCGV